MTVLSAREPSAAPAFLERDGQSLAAHREQHHATEPGRLSQRAARPPIRPATASAFTGERPRTMISCPARAHWPARASAIIPAPSVAILAALLRYVR
jgi:hypothetical protein